MLPTINTRGGCLQSGLDSHGHTIAAFDADTLGRRPLAVCRREGKSSRIGMAAPPVLLHKNQVVLEDGNAIVAVYPYRDSDATKITSLRRSCILVPGVPGVESGRLPAAYELAAEYLQRYAPGIL